MTLADFLTVFKHFSLLDCHFALRYLLLFEHDPSLLQVKIDAGVVEVHLVACSTHPLCVRAKGKSRDQCLGEKLRCG